jgi:hypothetical protein
MRSPNAAITALFGLLVVAQLVACSGQRSHEPTDSQAREQVFLRILSGPMRDQFSDSTLIAEGKKICAAKAQGQSWDQLEQLVAKDLNIDPDSRGGELSQFMGAIDGGLC